jgi:5-methylcytosine-specific restriction enzyme subunit McrC
MGLFQVSEYGTIRAERKVSKGFKRSNEIVVPNRTFDNLWDFILETQANHDESNRAFDLYTRAGKRIIKAKNFVGVIETKNGDTIEVLPKIYGISGTKESKKIFLKMLKVLQNFKNLSFQDANLESVDEFPILELFISNYVEEAEFLLINGFRKGYTKKESNLKYLKGRILFKEHLQKNAIDRSKFYVRHTQFSEDIAINRLIKSTCIKLIKLTKSVNNKRRLFKLNDLLENVPSSKSIDKDLTTSKNSNRLFNNYQKILKWSEIFLLNKGFTNFSGKTINQAMLFPMEKVFESFVAYQIRKYSNGVKISTQHQKYHLVEKFKEKPKYKLKPDVVATHDGGCIIIDTKWKVIEEGSKSKGIKQSDMYQLYAYGRKYLKGYGEPTLFLVYPYNEKFTSQLPPFYFEKEGDFWLKLYARPFDLRGNYQMQVSSLFDSFNQTKESIEATTNLLAAEPSINYGNKK